MAEKDLRRDELERLAGEQALARHALGQLAREAPFLGHGRRAAHRDALRRELVVRRLELRARRGLRPHLRLEPARGKRPRAGDPGALVLRAGHPGDQAHLAPGELVRDERALEGRKLREGAVHPRELLELAHREPRALARVIADPCIAEACVRLRREQPLGDRREHPAQRPHRSSQPREPVLRRLGLVPRVGLPEALGLQRRSTLRIRCDRFSERPARRRAVDPRAPLRCNGRLTLRVASGEIPRFSRCVRLHAGAGSRSELPTRGEGGVIDRVVEPAALLEAAFGEVRRLISLPAYGRVKQQLRSATIERLAQIVERDDEPLLTRWV